MKKIIIFSTLFLIISSLIAQPKLGIKEKLSEKYTTVIYHESLGFYSVSMNGRQGACDLNGREIVPCKYDFVLLMRSGYYKVEQNGKEGICNIHGKQLIPCKYDDIILQDGYYIVKLNGKDGICDLTGEEVVPCDYELAFYSKADNCYKVKVDGKILNYEANKKLYTRDEVLSHMPSNITEIKDSTYLSKSKTHQNLGDKFFKSTEYDKAINEFTISLQLTPGNAVLFNKRALSYVMLDQYSEALSDISQAIKIDPLNPDFHSSNGLILYCAGTNPKFNRKVRTKCYKASIDRFSYAIKLDNKSTSYYLYRGDVYRQCDRYSKAISDYKKVLQLDPNHKEAFNNLEIAKSKRSERTAAILTASAIVMGATATILNTANQSSTSHSSTNKSVEKKQTSIHSVNTRMCPSCYGTGNCQHCDTQGRYDACVRNPYGAECTDIDCIANNHRCKACGGSHVCKICGGDGKCGN